MTAKDFTKTAFALLCGAALALPAGFVLGRLGRSVEPEGIVHGDGRFRDMYSPSLRSDRYFLDRQREGVEALERYCERTGESCAEARAARLRLSQLEQRD